MNPAPQIAARSWHRLARVTDVPTHTDRVAHVAAAIASAHASGTRVQAVIGRPSQSTGRCVWLYGDVFQHDGAAAGAVPPLPARKVQQVVDAPSAWSVGGFELTPRLDRREHEDAEFGTQDVIYSQGQSPLLWVVTASPVPSAAAEAKRQALAVELARAEVQGAGHRSAVARLERLIDLLEERTALGGLWEVTVAVGADTDASCRGGRFALSRVVGLRDADVRPCDGPGWLGVDELTALIAPPSREMPGVRLIERAHFDQSIESNTGGRRVALGHVIAEDGSVTGTPFIVGEQTLNRHAFVTGATGSGKSETVRTLLRGATAQGIPWLVIEPAKAEYHRLTDVNGQPPLVLRPGDLRLPAAGLNPLEPTSVVGPDGRRTFDLQSHVDLISAVFEAAFSADEPFPQILAEALQRSYRSLGWDVAVGRPLRSGAEDPPYPTLSALRQHALSVVEDAGYGREVRDNVRGFINVRLGSLENGTPGQFFTWSHRLDLQRLAETNAVMQIENVGNPRDQAFTMGVVLVRWVELLRLIGPRDALAHLLVIEEAHRLLRRPHEGESGQAVEALANLLAEVRSYGQGIVVSEQIPSKIIPDVVKNSALKIMHRLPANDDRAFVGGTMNLDDVQTRAVVAFPPGVAAIHADGMDRPVKVQLAPPTPVPAMVRPRRDVPSQVATASCEAICGARQCDLEALARARRLRASWELRCWVDLAVLSALFGADRPSLSAALRRDARGMAGDAERLECGLGGLLDASVRSRWTHIAIHYDPDALVTDLRTATARYVVQGTWAEPRGEPRWRVGIWRWTDILRELRSADGDDPHPRTSEWQTAFPELRLPAEPVARQASAVQDAMDERRGDLLAVTFGSPSVLQTEPRFRTNPGAALRSMGVAQDWILKRLAPADAGDGTADQGAE